MVPFRTPSSNVPLAPSQGGLDSQKTSKKQTFFEIPVIKLALKLDPSAICVFVVHFSHFPPSLLFPAYMRFPWCSGYAPYNTSPMQPKPDQNAKNDFRSLFVRHFCAFWRSFVSIFLVLAQNQAGNLKETSKSYAGNNNQERRKMKKCTQKLTYKPFPKCS